MRRRFASAASIVAVGALLVLARIAAAQSATVFEDGAALRVRAPAFGFIEGPVLERLRDGRSVRVEIVLAVLARPDGQPVATARETCTISFDLWEERFAATRAGTPTRSISHLRASEAEAWCLDQVGVSRSSIGGLGRDTPLWIRVESRAELPAPQPVERDSVLALGRLIEALSERQPVSDPRRVIEAGPLRIIR